MPQERPEHRQAPPRCAVVDLGSNSVRLVVFEGRRRNPVAIFNEKAVLRLGRGVTATGRLNEQGVAQAMLVMHRYHALARAMAASPFEVLATAAVRDAENGPAFVESLRARMAGVAIRILTGLEEARLSAEGVLCGIPEADGVLADIGGGSLELVRLRPDGAGSAATLGLGVIRLADRSGADLARAREIAEQDLASVPWLGEGEGRELYLVGGAWRALARIHMAQSGYPLAMVHQYEVPREDARELASMVATASRRALERLPGVPRRRTEDLAYAAVVLRRLLRAGGARGLVFSATGIREGWFMARMPDAIRAQDPLLEIGRDYAARFARDPALPPDLIAWTAPLFPDEDAAQRRLREVACWMSDIGSHDHPEYRGEQAFLRVLRQPAVALDHHARAFLALCLGVRYESEPDAPFLRPARLLLDLGALRRAEALGLGLRLAYTLSGGTRQVLAGASLTREPRRLLLRLSEQAGVFAGESVQRRLDRLAQALGLEGVAVAE